MIQKNTQRRIKRVIGEWEWKMNKGVRLYEIWKVSKALESFRKCRLYLQQSVGYKFYKPREIKRVAGNKIF